LLKRKGPAPGARMSDLLVLFDNTPADDKFFTGNLAVIRKTIQEDFQFQLSAEDQASLENVYRGFRRDGLDTGFKMNRNFGHGFGGRAPGFNRFPVLRDLLAETDLNGKPGNFLASNEDYDFVREMQHRNLIIPVVGDFAGEKALRAVGNYLRQAGVTVSVFYTSNVEMLLFRNDMFSSFAKNVRNLPIDSRSLFIRSAFSFYPHQARVAGYSAFTLLQRIQVFLQDYDAGRYPSYYDLLLTHYIAADEPGRQ
jgi:hypothetical protein